MTDIIGFHLTGDRFVAASGKFFCKFELDINKTYEFLKPMLSWQDLNTDTRHEMDNLRTEKRQKLLLSDIGET